MPISPRTRQPTSLHLDASPSAQPILRKRLRPRPCDLHACDVFTLLPDDTRIHSRRRIKHSGKARSLGVEGQRLTRSRRGGYRMSLRTLSMRLSGSKESSTILTAKAFDFPPSRFGLAKGLDPLSFTAGAVSGRPRGLSIRVRRPSGSPKGVGASARHGSRRPAVPFFEVSWHSTGTPSHGHDPHHAPPHRGFQGAAP